jgi:hypothetical protein
MLIPWRLRRLRGATGGSPADLGVRPTGVCMLRYGQVSEECGHSFDRLAMQEVGE